MRLDDDYDDDDEDGGDYDDAGNEDIEHQVPDKVFVRHSDRTLKDISYMYVTTN